MKYNYGSDYGAIIIFTGVTILAISFFTMNYWLLLTGCALATIGFIFLT